VNAGDGMREAGEKGLAADREGRKEVTLDGLAGHRRGGCRTHPREMTAEIRDNGQLDRSHFLAV
jgi:hypothetical protein